MFPRTILAALVFSLCLNDAQAGDPWYEPPRYAKLTAEQKKWLEDKDEIKKRIDRLQASSSNHPTAMELTRNIIQGDAKILGDHKETAKSLYYTAGRYYYAGDFVTGMKLKEIEFNLYAQLFGKNNWRVRSVDFKLYMWQQLTKQNGKALRVLYGDAWRADDAADTLRSSNRNAEALEKSQESAAIMRRLNQAIGLADDDNPELAGIVLSVGKCQLNLGQYDKAEPTIRAALEVTKKNLGGDHPRYADTLTWLASVHMHRGDTAQAELAYRDALAVLERAFDYPHRDQVSALLDLARVYSDERKYGLAEATYQRAGKLLPEADSPYKSSRLNMLNGLATVCRSTNRLDDAEKHAREAMEYARETSKEKSQDFINASQELALILKAKKKYADALEVSEKALALQIEVTGGRHPYAAAIGSVCGDLRQLTGKHAEAEELLRGVLGNYRRNYGNRYAYTINTLNTLCELHGTVRDKHLKDGKVDLARDAQKKLVDARAEILPPDNWAVIAGRLRFAHADELAKKPEEDRKALLEADQAAVDVEALIKESKWKDALPFAEKVVAGRAALPAGALMAAEAKFRLGIIQHQLGDFAKSGPLLQTAMASYAKLFQGTLPPPAVVEAYFRLGQQARQRGDLSAAADHFETASDLYRRHYGKRHVDSINAARELFQTRLDLGHWRSLEADARELVDLHTKMDGPDSPQTFDAFNDLATILRLTNQVEPADKILADLVARTKPAAGPPGKDHVRYLNNLGLLRRQTGKLAEAAKLFEQCLDAHGEQVSTSDLVYAGYLANFATVQWELGQLDKAEPLLRRALGLYEKFERKHDRLAGRMVALLETRVAQQLAANKTDEASKAFNEMVDLLKKQYGPTHLSSQLAEARLKNLNALLKLTAEQRQSVILATGKTNEIQSDLAQGRFAEALKKCDGALATLTPILGSDHLDLVRPLMQKADAEAALGRPADALKLLDRALAIQVKTLAAQHLETAIIYLAMGRLHLDTGDTEPAVKVLQWATNLPSLPTAEARASAVRGEAAALLGLAHLRRGEFILAKTPIDVALDILYRQQADFPDEYALALLVHAEWLMGAGDAPRAEEEVAHAGALLVARAPGNNKLLAQALLLKAKLLSTAKESFPALNVAKQAESVIAKHFGEASATHAEALGLVGALQLKQGNLKDAKDSIEQAKRIRAAALPVDHPGSTANPWLAGLLAEKQDDLATAEKEYRAALTARQKHQQDAVETLLALAGVLHRQGKLDEAEPLYRQAIEASRKFADSLRTVQTDFPLMVVQQRARLAIDRLLSLPATQARNEAIYADLLRAKGAAGERSSLLLAARDRPDLANLFLRREELAVRLATMATRVPYGEERTWWYSRVEALTDEWERLEVDILRAARAEPPKRATLDELSKALPAKSALIDFVEYTRATPPAKGERPWNETRELAAFIVRPGQPLQRVELGSASRIAQAIYRWREAHKKFNEMMFLVEAKQIKKEDLDQLKGVGEEGDAASGEVRDLLFTKLADAFDGAETVYVSPDGELAKFPFGALLRADGAYVLEKCNLLIAPAPALLPRALAAKGAGDPRLLALGGIDFNATPEKIIEKAPVLPKNNQLLAGALFDRPGLKFLMQTGPEVQGASKTFRQRYNEQAAVLYMAREATENQYRAHIGRSNWVHLATHGFFIPKLVRDYVDRGAGPAVHIQAPGGLGTPRILYDPGLFAGLTLAGANEANDPDQDDGILWSLEIASRDLRHVELAIMSACDTADGVVVPGEGVVGLQRAYHMAGAKSVISTLWPVNDLVARQLMERFYQNVHDKKMKQPEALREAQLWLLESGRKALKKENDPNYPQVSVRYFFPRVWAPFIMSMEGR